MRRAGLSTTGGRISSSCFGNVSVLGVDNIDTSAKIPDSEGVAYVSKKLQVTPSEAVKTRKK